MRIKKSIVLLLLIVVLLICRSSHAALGDVIKSWNAPGTFSRGLEWDGTNIWYSSVGEDTVYKLNPLNGNIITSFPTANINTGDLTFVGSDLWNIDIFSRGFYSVNPSVGPPWALEFSKPGNDYLGLTYDGTNLWASDFNFDQIVKMDLSGNVLSSFSAPDLGTSGLAWDGTFLWNSDTNTNLIYKIDPSTGNVISSFTAPGLGAPTGLAFDGQYLWSTDIGTNAVYQLDAGYAAPVGPTPAPPGIVSMLTMLASLGGWAGLGRLRGRIRKAKHST